MRHVFHEILARYLDSEQHAFDASPRELWPSEPSVWHRQAASAAGLAAEPGQRRAAYRELEPQN